MAEVEEIEDNDGSPRLFWAKQPITQAECKAAKERLEATLAELRGAASVSTDAKIAKLSGELEAMLVIYSMFIRSEHPEYGNAVATFGFRKK